MGAEAEAGGVIAMANLDMFFKPNAIAVVGANNKELTIPFRIISNL